MIYLILIVLVCICISVAAANSENEKSAAKETERRLLDAQASVESERLRLAAEREEVRVEQERNAKDQEERSSASRRPDALVRLFAEEFPRFSDDITYAKADELLEKFDLMWKADLVQDTLATRGGGRDSLVTDPDVQRWFIMKVTPIISPGFHDYASKNPEEFMAGLLRAINSSSKLAGVQQC